MASLTITLTADQVQSVLTQDGMVANLQTQLNAANASITTLTADRDAQKTRADTAEARLAALNADIDAVQAKD